MLKIYVDNLLHCISKIIMYEYQDSPTEISIQWVVSQMYLSFFYFQAAKKKNESALAHMQFIRTYISYLRQRLTIERNLLMIDSMKDKLPALIGQSKQVAKGKTSKPEDLVR